MKITVEGWCAERAVGTEGRRELDLTTLAMTQEHCLQRLRIADALATPEWLNAHPYQRIRKVEINTVDEE